MPIPYYQVDAFTGELFRGNPAGVCIPSAFPADDLMQKIAAENRHSETAFVVPRGNGDFDLRWFTPTIEDDLCGHATLASAFVLALRKHDVWPVRFHTRAGLLTVDQGPDRFEDSFVLDFPSRPPQPCETPAGLLPALGLSSGPKAPPVMKSRDYLVVLDDAEQVRALSPDMLALAQLNIANGGTIVTAPGPGIQNAAAGRHAGLEDDASHTSPDDLAAVDYVCRLFSPSEGIPEDPATGSIHCTLAPYWAERLAKNTLRAQQLSARGGFMQATLDGERVKITGQARLYLHGMLEV